MNATSFFFGSQGGPGFVFVNWTGSLTSPQNPASMTLGYGDYLFKLTF